MEKLFSTFDHINLLADKYNCYRHSLVSMWTSLGRCSMIRLEMVIKETITNGVSE